MHKSHLPALFLISSLFCAPASSADVYKCKSKDGATTFSDTPCSDRAEAVKLRNSGPTTSNREPVVWCADGPAPTDLVQACVDQWRPRLRDPRAAYADSGQLVHELKSGAQQVFVDGHAKNGFGGMNSMLMQCGVKDGVLDAAATKIWFDLDDIKGNTPRDKFPPPLVKSCP